MVRIFSRRLLLPRDRPQRVGGDTERQVVFVDDISEVPSAPVMLSAHGSAPDVVAGAEERASRHRRRVPPRHQSPRGRRMAAKGYDIIYVGHEGHDEAVGTLAEHRTPSPSSGPSGNRPVSAGRPGPSPSRLEPPWACTVKSRRGPGRTRTCRCHRSDLCYATTSTGRRWPNSPAMRRDPRRRLETSTPRRSSLLARHAGLPYRLGRRSAGSSGSRWSASRRVPLLVLVRVIDRVDPALGFELWKVTEEGEYFPLPPQLRSFVTTLGALVEAGVTAMPSAQPGWLDRDREWTATEALASIAT